MALTASLYPVSWIRQVGVFHLPDSKRSRLQLLTDTYMLVIALTTFAADLHICMSQLFIWRMAELGCIAAIAPGQV